MLTMTSLDAQNQFGTLIDSSQRQPVTVTRRGRPIAVVLSYDDYIQRTKTIPFELAKLLSEKFPLRGKEASIAIEQQLASMSNLAAEEGMTEDDIIKILNDE